MFPKDDIVPLLLKQNGLEGAHSTPHFRSKDKGVSIVAMGIAPQLVNGIRALGTLQIFIVILLCKSIKVMGKMYKLMIGKILCKNYP